MHGKNECWTPYEMQYKYFKIKLQISLVAVWKTSHSTPSHPSADCISVNVQNTHHVSNAYDCEVAHERPSNSSETNAIAFVMPKNC